MTPSGTEPSTFRHITHCLNQLRQPRTAGFLNTIHINFTLQSEANWKTCDRKCQMLYCVSPHIINQGTSPGRDISHSVETQVSQQGISQFRYTICLQGKTFEIILITWRTVDVTLPSACMSPCLFFCETYLFPSRFRFNQCEVVNRKLRVGPHLHRASVNLRGASRK